MKLRDKHSGLLGLLLLIVVLSLPGCRQGVSDEVKHTEAPAQIKPLAFEGTFNPEGGRVDEGIILTDKAAERIAIETTKINAIRNKAGQMRKAIPYAAVLYDPNGKTWVYTERKPLTFLREPVTIESIEDTVAILAKGPEVGTTIATMGIAMLYGVENGVGQ